MEDAQILPPSSSQQQQEQKKQEELEQKQPAAVENTQQQQQSQNTTATATAGGEKQEAVAWSISFGPSTKGKKTKPKRSAKEKAALASNRGENGQQQATPSGSDADQASSTQQKDEEEAEQQQKPTTTKKKELEVVNLNDEPIDEAIAIPRNLTTTREDLLARHHFDTNRWLCLSRPQYKRSCGVSSLTSVWNTLYSRVGYGQLPPISQEEVMTIIGFKPPFEDIRWGPFTGNTSLMRWFYKVNKAKGVKGKAYYFWKPHGTGRTIGVTDEKAEEMTMDALRSKHIALIYHCLNHYMTPIGFRQDARAPRMALLPKLERSDVDLRLLIGEPSRGGMPSIHEKLFTDVAKDMHTEAPFKFNIRHIERGVQKREKCKKVGGTLHCFIGFRSDVEGEAEEMLGDEEDEEDENENLKEDEDDE